MKLKRKGVLKRKLVLVNVTPYFIIKVGFCNNCPILQ